MKIGKNFSFPLGIDLIELKKAKIFYQTHKKRLNSFLSNKEIRYINKSSRPHEALGVLLAAKEAVFKALSPSGTGIAAFRNIEISPGQKDKFYFRFTTAEKETSLKLSVLKNKKVVMVQCVGI